MAFKDFPLHETLLGNLAGMGFTNPTDIQAQILPVALEGKDVSGLSRTGTGKTAAFLIPTLQRLTQLPEDRIALCLAPTRELAQQIEQEAKRISQGLGIGTISVVGGMSSDDQIAALKGGARLVTGTPGRIIDLFKERALNLANVDVLVFDEADRMFDMGFIKDMHYILSKVNPKRQILLFSATMNFSVLNIVYEYGANPQEINVSRDMLTAEKIQQVLYHVGDKEKAASLLAVCNKHSPDKGSIIVFVNYKERVPWVAALLSRNGISAQGLSSLLRQERRNKIIQGFKKGEFRALVATDVASRGLDVDDISLVVNYHLPEEAATYVHRIGRTARAGRHGIAVAICSSEDAYNQMRVEEFLGNKIPVEWLNEEDMPKEMKMPHRSDEREFSDDDEATEGGAEGHRGRGGRDRRPEGRRERGDRPQRGPRHERPERHERKAEAPAEQPVLATAGVESAPAAPEAPARQPRAAARPEREQHAERAPRHERSERTDRGERHPRGGQRGRGERGDRGERHHRREGREAGRDLPVDGAAMPNPLTGNPVIYDMKTGRPKNRTPEEFRSFLAEHKSRVDPGAEKFTGKKKAAPAIIKKISSKVTALFGKRGD
jgi:ATP-dependent RNA helicase RhlB